MFGPFSGVRLVIRRPHKKLQNATHNGALIFLSYSENKIYKTSRRRKLCTWLPSECYTFYVKKKREMDYEFANESYFQLIL